MMIITTTTTIIIIIIIIIIITTVISIQQSYTKKLDTYVSHILKNININIKRIQLQELLGVWRWPMNF